jgi:hypothetical protein
MILKGLSEVTAYRMHVPKWAGLQMAARESCSGHACHLMA